MNFLEELCFITHKTAQVILKMPVFENCDLRIPNTVDIATGILKIFLKPISEDLQIMKRSNRSIRPTGFKVATLPPFLLSKSLIWPTNG